MYVFCSGRRGCRGGGGQWMRGLGLGLGLTSPVGTGGVFDVCLCLGAVVWVAKSHSSPLCPLCNTHIHNTHVSSTAPTYAPRCHPWICGQTPSE